MTATFRVREGYRSRVIACLTLFVAIGVASAYVAWADLANERRMFATVLFSVFWGAWVGVSVWSLLTYYLGRLEITNDVIAQRGVVGHKKIDLERVIAARWRTPNRGHIIIATSATNLHIYFDWFEPAERLWLIRYLRRALPAEVQKDWPAFCHSVANPLRDRALGLDGVCAADKALITRRRWDWYFLPFIALCGLIGLVLCWTLQTPKMLAAPLFPAPLWLVLRYTTPRRGLVVTRIDAATKRFLLLLFLWMALAIGGIHWFERLRLPRPQAMALGGAAFVVWFGAFLGQGNRLDRARQKEVQAKREGALEHWEHGERGIATDTEYSL